MERIDYFLQKADRGMQALIPYHVRSTKLPDEVYTITTSGHPVFNDAIFDSAPLALFSTNMAVAHANRLSRLNTLLQRGVLTEPLDVHATLKRLCAQESMKSIHTIFDRLSDINMLIRRLPWSLEDEELSRVCSLYQDLLDTKRRWSMVVRAGWEAHSRLIKVSSILERNQGTYRRQDVLLSCEPLLEAYIASLAPPVLATEQLNFNLDPAAGENFIVHERHLVITQATSDGLVTDIINIDEKLVPLLTAYIQARRSSGFQRLFSER